MGTCAWITRGALNFTTFIVSEGGDFIWSEEGPCAQGRRDREMRPQARPPQVLEDPRKGSSSPRASRGSLALAGPSFWTFTPQNSGRTNAIASVHEVRGDCYSNQRKRMQ